MIDWVMMRWWVGREREGDGMFTCAFYLCSSLLDTDEWVVSSPAYSRLQDG